MSRAPGVKINNNLQVAVCLRVGWQSLWGRLWKCRVSRSAPRVHGLGLILLLLGPESEIGRYNNSRKFKWRSRALTLSFCVYPLAGPHPTDSPRILTFTFYPCILKRNVLDSLHSLKTFMGSWTKQSNNHNWPEVRRSSSSSNIWNCRCLRCRSLWAFASFLLVIWTDQIAVCKCISAAKTLKWCKKHGKNASPCRLREGEKQLRQLQHKWW